MRMKTKAVRLYGKGDLRLEEFDLPPIGPGEILVRLVCDSLCMSSYKAVIEGPDHKRVPKDIAQNPIIIGHEFGGEILEVGSKWKDSFRVGDKFSVQPAINYEKGPVGLMSAPGYSYPYIGGDAQYAIVHEDILRQHCLMRYEGEGFYRASLAEPLSCVIGTMHAHYHSAQGSYKHEMDIKPGGRMAFLAGVGPMGLAALSYALNRTEVHPALLVVTDIDSVRLQRAEALFSKEFARAKGVELIYLNTAELEDPVKYLRGLSGGIGFDDVIVFAPVPALIEQADDILGHDGCLNFFAGPAHSDFKAKMNFYQVHYGFTHIVGTTGGNSNDMLEALSIMSKGLDPAFLVTHIGGLNAVVETTLNLPSIPGGKKLIYNAIDMPLTAIADFKTLGQQSPLFASLAEICDRHSGLWNVEAERYLLEHGKKL